MANHSKNKLTKPFIIGLSALIIFASAVASSAYWTDILNIRETVKALDISVKYDEDTALLSDGLRFIPGEVRDIAFTVVNDGDISVDIKPVITISSEKDMQSGGNGFELTRRDGADIGEFYEARYYDAEGALIGNDPGNQAYRKVTYTYLGELTLSGKEQNDEEYGEATNNTANFSDLSILLRRETGNNFMQTAAELNVDTYAIQHRNRDTDDADWIESAEKIQGS